MTQVSKYKLRPEVWHKIFDLFSESLSGIKNKANFDTFLNDFLSPTEKIMLAKRFAIGVLLSKGNSYQQIESILHVTSATISKVSVSIKYNQKGINETIENALKKDATRLVWEEIQSLFDLPTKGLPISEYQIKVKNRARRIRELEKRI